MTRIPMSPTRPVGPERRVSRKACPTASSRHTSRTALSVRSAPSTAGATAQAAIRAGVCVAQTTPTTRMRSSDGSRNSVVS